MAQVPLSTSFATLFKVKTHALLAVDRWEKTMTAQVLAGAPIISWLNEVYRLRLFLEQNKWPQLPTFDPDCQFFRFMENWKAGLLARQTQQILDYQMASTTQLTVQPTDKVEGASRLLAVLGIEADAGDDQQLNSMDESEDDSAAEMLMSMTPSPSTTPVSNQKSSISVPYPSSLVSSDPSPDAPCGELRTPPPESLTYQMMQRLNLVENCEMEMWRLEINLKFRIRTKKTDLPDLITRVRAFCRSNAKPQGFYDESGCLTSLIQNWHEHQLYEQMVSAK